MPHKDPSARAAYFSAYHKKHQSKKLAYAAVYRVEHPEDRRIKQQRSKAYYDAKKEYWREKHREYDAQYAAEIKARMKAYNQRPEVVERNKARRASNRELLNAQGRANYQKNRTKRIQHVVRLNRRRAEQSRTAGGNFTKAEWDEICRQYDNRCLRCGRQEPSVKITVDHVVPLSAGGSNEISNLQPLCKSCNSIKGTKVADYRAVSIPRLASAYQPGPAEELKTIDPLMAESASL